jgi:tetratricopeptide (TPR) repeat protein
MGLDAPECYAYLARCRHQAGDLTQALEFCQQWVNAARDAESRGYQALLQMDRGNMADARQAAEAVLRDDPENVNAGLVAGTASIETQDIARAADQFERILTREPDNARAWLGVGLARLYQQQTAEAIAALEKATQLVPDSVGILVTLGWATVVARDVARGEQVFRRALEIDRNFGEAHGGLATVLAMQMRIDAAREAIHRARRLDPHGFGATFAQTIILELQGKHQTATDILAKLLQQAPRPDARTLLEQIEIFVRANPPPTHRAPGGSRNGSRQ